MLMEASAAPVASPVAADVVQARRSYFEQLAARAPPLAGPTLARSDSDVELSSLKASSSAGVRLAAVEEASAASVQPALPSLPQQTSGSSSLRRLSSTQFRRVSSASSRHNSQGNPEEAFKEMQELITALAVASEADARKCQHLEQLVDKVNALGAVVETASRLERENENLTSVLREVTATRAEAIRLKVLTLESYHSLQSQYERALKSMQVQQQISRGNFSKAQRLTKELQDSKLEVLRLRKQVAGLTQRNAALRDQNSALRTRLATSEQMAALADCRTSACLAQFVGSKAVGFY